MNLKSILIFILLTIFGVACVLRLWAYWNGLPVSSWFRSPWHNFEVGGKGFSLHQLGWALDIPLMNDKTSNIVHYSPFKVVKEDSHFHIQLI